jgi:hypothetical protein
MFRPVKVRVPESEAPKIITSLPEATEFIIARWPPHQSATLEDAREKCLDAIAGKISADVARACFVAAAKEAGIYVKRSRMKKLAAVIAGTDPLPVLIEQSKA